MRMPAPKSESAASVDDRFAEQTYAGVLGKLIAFILVAPWKDGPTRAFKVRSEKSITNVKR